MNVQGLIKNRHLSKALSDAAFGAIRTQTEYKCERYGSCLILADRFFPSSQLCSECGHRQKMPLSVRIYDCGDCGSKKDRDFNASLNLENARGVSGWFGHFKICGRGAADSLG